MLNHKTIFKQKSKILLTIICIFGLAFSYSCSCRDNPVAPPPETPVDPTVFSISTSSIETRLVQKADGSGFNYQPSIKFSEANVNQFTVSYEVTDNDTANKIEKTNITYNEKDGLITFDKTAVLDKLATSKKSITITFTVKANDTTLQNPETNFTINVDLKKTAGAIDTKEHIGKIFKQVLTFAPTGFPLTIMFESEPTSSEIKATTKGSDDGRNKGEVKFNKNNFITSLETNLKETAVKSGKSGITYKKMELINDEPGATAVWSFNFKFIFSDEDYDLTEEQKTDGVKFRFDITIGDKDNLIDGTYVTWM